MKTKINSYRACFLIFWSFIIVMTLSGNMLAPESSVKKFDLIVRTEISINRPPADVWPLLFKVKEWKSSIDKLERVAGEPNKEGETLRVTPKGTGEDQGYFIKYVRVEENRQLVIKIFNIPDDGAVGYSDFSLFESKGKTDMIYDVYVEYRLPGMSEEEVRKFGSRAYSATKEKLESENQKLKELVEAGI
ncbi:MAG: hypothetical protein JXB23_04415 [Candidatus Aminicenantes bacterium]|nr:hypothetical protein [Candidatus Aminicenantes bacterium]